MLDTNESETMTAAEELSNAGRGSVAAERSRSQRLMKDSFLVGRHLRIVMHTDLQEPAGTVIHNRTAMHPHRSSPAKLGLVSDL